MRLNQSYVKMLLNKKKRLFLCLFFSNITKHYISVDLTKKCCANKNISLNIIPVSYCSGQKLYKHYLPIVFSLKKFKSITICIFHIFLLTNIIINYSPIGDYLFCRCCTLFN